MDLLPDDSQEELITAFNRTIADTFPADQTLLRCNQQDWNTFAQLGWFGISIPEKAGGVGMTIAEECLLFREYGRFLVPGPVLATSLAARLSSIRDQSIFDALVTGKKRAALAVATDGGEHLVFDGADADFAIVVTPARAQLYEMPAASIASRACIDPSCTLEVRHLSVVDSVAVDAAEFDVHSHALILVAAMAVGVAEAARDASTEYAKLRKQFGRPIGMFQAVSHRCADMAARADLAFMQMSLGALCLAEGYPDGAYQANVAKLTATEAAVLNSADNIQNHGGIGFTELMPLHRYVKRAHLLEHLISSRRSCLEAVLAAPSGVQLEI